MKSFFLFFFISLNLGKDRFPNKISDTAIQKEKYLPVYISYRDKKTPDSVQQYFKMAFQERKIKVIGREEMERLAKKEIDRVFNVIKSNNFDSPESMRDQIEHFTQPVYNSLQIYFSFYDDRNGFSLQWMTYTNLMIAQMKVAEWRKISTKELENLHLRNAIEAVVDSIILSKKLQ